MVPVHSPNELYDTRARILVLEGPLSNRVTRRINRLLRGPRFTDLDANLEYFREVYGDILTERDEIIAGGFLPLRGVRYLRVSKRYYEYIEGQLAEVDEMQLEALRAAP